MGDNPTVRLDLDNEPQPDAVLLIDSTRGGKSSISADGYIEGAPELIAEIAVSSAAIDLGDKKRAYRRMVFKNTSFGKCLSKGWTGFIWTQASMFH